MQSRSTRDNIRVVVHQAFWKGFQMAKHKWEAEWTGEFPNLCMGHWRLFKDGSEVKNVRIPFNGYIEITDENAGQFEDDDVLRGFVAETFGGECAETEGVYSFYTFDNCWNDESHSYSDGFDCESWCDEYSEWLSQIDPEGTEREAIFKAFQKNDWRRGSCGGCL